MNNGGRMDVWLTPELDRLERAETLTAIRRSMEQGQRGEGLPLEEAEERLRKKLGLPRGA